MLLLKTLNLNRVIVKFTKSIIEMKNYNILLFMVAIPLVFSCSTVSRKTIVDEPGWNDEIIYHVFQRSFYDSNGDLHGDLNGLVEKLDYLKDLGVTTILLTPLYESGFYHNYFPTDYEKIDPEYGTKQDYLNFVKAVHKKGMKFLMDMETQYAQNGNKWFDDSYKNPKSQYSDFIYYSDTLNQFPEQIFMPSKSPLYNFKAWPDKEYNLVLLNLNNQRVRGWMIDFYAYWVDPNGDGNFDDGVDGFRIDHIMDDLDNKGVFTNMYSQFWKPIFQRCKTINPKVFILGEQANWNEYGDKMVSESGADAAFNFPLRFALANVKGAQDMYIDQTATGVRIEPDRICTEISESMKRFSGNIYIVNFLENHDLNRWSSVVNGNVGQLRIGAVLNILLPGVPSIYYGQELGVTGKIQEWGYDVNHIPVREAFPWTPNPNEPGTAVFYKETGPWWDQSYFKTGESEKFALSVQQKDPSSIWNFYRKFIHFRKTSGAIMNGDFKRIETSNPEMLAFSRETPNEKVMVMLNLSEKSIVIKSPSSKKYEFQEKASIKADSLFFQPYGFVIYKEK
jgi:glycosidase